MILLHEASAVLEDAKVDVRPTLQWFRLSHEMINVTTNGETSTVTDGLVGLGAVGDGAGPLLKRLLDGRGAVLLLHRLQVHDDAAGRGEGA